jgi:hypothetical protein
MPTLLDPHDRAATLARLRRLTPATEARWGRFDAPRMLCHLADQLRVALGEIPTRFTGNFLSRTLVRWLVIYVPFQPPPGKIETAPEMLTSCPAGWTDDLQELEALIERTGRGEARAMHPFFGRLSPEAWGRLAWKHLDHHLRQFGV